jgi:hypothetical protein
VFVNALKAGHDDNLPVGQRLAHPSGRNAFDARLGVRTVGDNADLGAGEADGAFAERLNGHRHEGDGNLLAGGQKHVHFAGGRRVAQFAGQFDQLVGGIAARADDHDDLTAFLLGADGFARGRHDAFRVFEAGAAEFLHDQTQ